MYSVDLAQITLDDFEVIINSVDLLPSRRILLEGLSAVIFQLKQKEIEHLAALQKMLRNKKHYPELAGELSVTSEYLTILNREINSYVSKPISLSKLDVFSDSELNQLQEAGLKSTKDLYEHCLTQAARQALCEQLEFSMEQLVAALELADLLRINGVGPVYARILVEIGIRNTTDYLKTDSSEILEKYRNLNEEKRDTKAHLGIKDIEYCKRFCEKLDVEIEWW